MSSPNYITTGDILLTTLYVQFQVNLHDADDVSSVFVIGDDVNGSVLNCYQDSGQLKIQQSGLSTPSIALDEWHTVDIVVYVVPPDLALVNARLDGIKFGISSASDCLRPLEILGFWFGAIGAGEPGVNHELRGMKLGTGGFGSDNLFSFDLRKADVTDSLVPQFDSTTGEGIIIGSDSVSFENAGTDVYASKAFIFP